MSYKQSKTAGLISREKLRKPTAFRHLYKDLYNQAVTFLKKSAPELLDKGIGDDSPRLPCDSGLSDVSKLRSTRRRKSPLTISTQKKASQADRPPSVVVTVPAGDVGDNSQPLKLSFKRSQPSGFFKKPLKKGSGLGISLRQAAKNKKTLHQTKRLLSLLDELKSFDNGQLEEINSRLDKLCAEVNKQHTLASPSPLKAASPIK